MIIAIAWALAYSFGSITTALAVYVRIAGGR